MTARKLITVHCWLPNLNIIALGIGSGGILLGPLLLPLLSADFWSPTNTLLLGAGLLGIALLTCALAYCRITVTPWEVSVLGSGIWKGRYSCPLEKAVIGGWWGLDGQWGLGKPATFADYQHAVLSISLEEDWDTETPYLRIQHYGEEVFNLFRAKQYAEIQDAFDAMRTGRHLLDTQNTELNPAANA